mgnify:FL=1
MHNSTKYNKKSAFLCTASALAMLAFAPAPAYSNPDGATVSAGSATITESGKKMDVHQHTDRAVIDWRSFNIGVDEHTQFHQPSSSSTALNRINDTDPSKILGKLSANGNLILINPNGLFFGQNSVVDVNSLVATTADISNEDFMNGGVLHFDKPGNPNATITNEGLITAKQAGLVGLVAPSVVNSGIIRAHVVELASADGLTLDLYGDGLMGVSVSDDMREQLIRNTGTIDATNGGAINLTANAGKNIINSLIEIDGELTAPAIDTSGGTIKITARDIEIGSNAQITADGTGDASVPSPPGATPDNRGFNGGGTILIGGDYLGSGDMQTAQNVTVEDGALITANAVGTGDGGKVIVWSDNRTDFDGRIEARGGNEYGHGGFVETSGKIELDIRTGSVDTGAAAGQGGLWLLDPNNIIISNLADKNISGDPNFVSTDDSAVINATTLLSALSGGNVTVTTQSAGTNSEDGNITVNADLNWSANTLSLDADNDIIVNSDLIIGGSGALEIDTRGGTLTGGEGTGFLVPGSITYTNTSPAADALNINGENYTLIFDAAGLQAIDTVAGVSGGDDFYAMANNIDLGGTIPLVIGVDSDRTDFFFDTPFEGQFNGLGHDVQNLTINQPTHIFVGLFGRTSSGSDIRNIGLTNADLTGNFSVGGLVGENAGTISMSYATGNMDGTNRIGGLVGQNDGTIDQSYATAGLTGSDWDVGGLVGRTGGTIDQSYATQGVRSGS